MPKTQEIRWEGHVGNSLLLSVCSSSAQCFGTTVIALFPVLYCTLIFRVKSHHTRRDPRCGLGDLITTLWKERCVLFFGTICCSVAQNSSYPMLQKQ